MTWNFARLILIKNNHPIFHGIFDLGFLKNVVKNGGHRFIFIPNRNLSVQIKILGAKSKPEFTLVFDGLQYLFQAYIPVIQVQPGVLAENAGVCRKQTQ